MYGQREEYWARINRALDYIEQNLDKQLTLREIAEVAHFSPFHFHRIFRALVGESINQFIQRVRMEKAAALLLANPGRKVTEIALDCGYTSSAAFARVFKDTFGISATTWRHNVYPKRQSMSQMIRKNGKTVRNTGQTQERFELYSDGVVGHHLLNKKMRSTAMDVLTKPDVRVEDIPEMDVAYVRHIGPYAGNEQLFKGLFERLMRWAGPRGLIRFPETRMISVYHDDPELTDQDKLRVSCCITVPSGTPVEGEIGRMTLPGGKYAMARFEINPSEYGDAWNVACGAWLPESGYQPDDRPCFELYLNNPDDHPEHKHIVDICIPVKPL